MHLEKPLITWPATLRRLARLAAEQKRLDRAVRLWGAAKAIHDTRGIRRALGASLDNEHDLTAARDQLGEVPFTAAWAAGQAMTLEQSIDYALAGSEDQSVGSARIALATQ